MVTQIKDRHALLFILPIVLFFSFAKLGHAPIHQWDEARTGINAIEMTKQGDLINLYFCGAPDKIRAKPPLVIWWVAANLKWFGYNTFGLRLHSAIAAVFIFLLLYGIIRIYTKPLLALLPLLVLISVRGILGFHVGRTGDFDAVLIAFLLGGLYCFLLFYEEKWKGGIWAAAICWGLAFWTKGPAMAVYFPGLALWLIWEKQFLQTVKRPIVWASLGIGTGFVLLWYLLVHQFGVSLEQPMVSGKNAFERMFLYDLLDRFTNTKFEGKVENADPAFFWKTTQVTFAIWNYVLTGILIVGLVSFFKGLIGGRRDPGIRLLVLSVLIWGSLAVFLSMVTATKPWYLSPAIPFMAITVSFGVWYLMEKRQSWLAVFLGIWLFAMYFRYLGPAPLPTAGASSSDFHTNLFTQQLTSLRQARQIFIVDSLPQQRLVLELYFINRKVTFLPNFGDLSQANFLPNHLIFGRKNLLMPNIEGKSNFSVIDVDEHYVLLKKNTLDRVD